MGHCQWPAEGNCQVSHQLLLGSMWQHFMAAPSQSLICFTVNRFHIILYNFVIKIIFELLESVRAPLSSIRAGEFVTLPAAAFKIAKESSCADPQWNATTFCVVHQLAMSNQERLLQFRAARDPAKSAKGPARKVTHPERSHSQLLVLRPRRDFLTSMSHPWRTPEINLTLDYSECLGRCLPSSRCRYCLHIVSACLKCLSSNFLQITEIP